MSNELRIVAFLAICLLLALVIFVGHIVLIHTTKQTNSLEGENHNVNP